MTKELMQEFAHQISTSLLLPKEVKEAVKERMSKNALTKEEMEKIIEILGKEKDVKKRLNEIIKNNFNNN